MSNWDNKLIFVWKIRFNSNFMKYRCKNRSEEQLHWNKSLPVGTKNRLGNKFIHRKYKFIDKKSLYIIVGIMMITTTILEDIINQLMDFIVIRTLTIYNGKKKGFAFWKDKMMTTFVALEEEFKVVQLYVNIWTPHQDMMAFITVIMAKSFTKKGPLIMNNQQIIMERLKNTILIARYRTENIIDVLALNMIPQVDQLIPLLIVLLQEITIDY